MKNNYLITIKAEDRPGLLHLITGLINKKQVPVKSLNAAATDIHEIVLVTIEAVAAEGEMASLAFKLENIIEVFAVEVKAFDQVLCLRAAYFKMARAFMDTPKVWVLQKYGAVIVNFRPDTVLVAKYGSDLSIRNLYNELEGLHLLGFSQTGLIGDSALIGSKGEESSVIRLAA